MLLVPPVRGISMSARLSAFITFVAYLISQGYVLNLSPTEIHRAYYPHNSFTVAFVVASGFLNVQWLRRLLFAQASTDILPTSVPDEEVASKGDLHSRMDIHESIEARCLPSYILGNIFLIISNVAWIWGYNPVSEISLMGNIGAQFYSVSVLLQSAIEPSILPFDFLTHAVVKTNVGLGVLYIWRMWGLLNRMTSPTTSDLVNTGVIFLLMTVATGPDPLLGICLLYDLASLVFGHSDPGNDQWQRAFRWIMIFISLCILVEFLLAKGQSFVISWSEVIKSSITGRQKRQAYIRGGPSTSRLALEGISPA